MVKQPLEVPLPGKHSSFKRPSLRKFSPLRLLGRSSGATRTAVLGGTLLAIVAAPFALAAGEGNPIKGGSRNPSSNASLSYSKETQVIADNSGYGTRQSNKGTGGGAIYGCRSLITGPGCIAAVNLNSGHAFSFTSNGTVGGVILLNNKAGAPLTTNATGVATGFNANYLQGKEAKEFVTTTQAAAYAQTNQLLFADVGATGALGATRGATASAQTGEKSYTVTFNVNISKCALTASPVGGALTTGSLGVALSTTNPQIAEVNAPSALPAGFNLQVVC